MNNVSSRTTTGRQRSREQLIRASTRALAQPIDRHESTGPFRQGSRKGTASARSFAEKTGPGLYRLSAAAVEVRERLDRCFVALANGFSAEPCAYPATVSSQLLRKAGYLKNFSPQVQFLAPGRSCGCAASSGKTAAGSALLPAACLPCYAQWEKKRLVKPLTVVTTRNRVFRRETRPANFFVMNEFHMREIVFLGSEPAVRRGLDQTLARVKQLAIDLDFPFTLNLSADLFYGQGQKERALFQLLNRSKIELRGRTGGRPEAVALSSVNYHGTHFGKAFRIAARGQVAHTGCVAFGLERWALFFLLRYGPDPARWPAKIRTVFQCLP